MNGKQWLVDIDRYKKFLKTPESFHSGAGSTFIVIASQKFREKYRFETKWKFGTFRGYHFFEKIIPGI